MITKAFIFDFDDTLASTDAMVNVMRDGEIIKSLTSHEYAAYQLEQGEEFCFAQFRQAEYIQKSAILDLGEYAIQLSKEGHDLFILTARQPIVANAIQERLEVIGIRVKVVYCVGKPNADISAEKREVLLTLIEKYDRIYFYDDDARNIQQAATLGIQAKHVRN